MAIDAYGYFDGVIDGRIEGKAEGIEEGRRQMLKIVLDTLPRYISVDERANVMNNFKNAMGRIMNEEDESDG